MMHTMSRLLKSATSRLLSSRSETRIYFCTQLQKLPNTEDSRMPKDLMLQTIRSSQTTKELLNTTSRHIQVMNHKHLMQVLRSIFEIYRDQKSDMSVNELTRNPTFGTICQAIKQNARVLETNEFIEALKILSYLKIPTNTVIMQTMLQLIRKNINDFNIKQIMFIDFVISKYDESVPLVDALKLALPLVFQIHLPLELDHEDLPLLNEMLAYACSHDVPNRCINNIVTGLLLHGDDIDHKTARNILWSLASISVNTQYDEMRYKLLQICFKIVSDNIKLYHFEEVLTLSAKLKSRCIEKHMEFYNEELFDAFSKFVIDQSLDLEKSLLLSRNITKVNHTNLQLAEYLTKLAHENLEYISIARPNMVCSFVHCLANASYEPEPKKWNDIRQHLSMNPIMKPTNMKLPYSRLTLELASLGHYDLNFLSHFFSEDFMLPYMEDLGPLDHMHVLHIHEGAKLFCEGYNLSPPKQILEKAIQIYSVYSENHLLEGPLTMELGGEDYHTGNVQLPCGIVVDHIIALQNGVPIKINRLIKGEKISLDNLGLPSDAVVVCILKFNKTCYSVNNDRLRGHFNLMLNILEGQGYPTVAVNVHSWVQMPEREQAPYLVREVKMKCEDLGVSFNYNA